MRSQRRRYDRIFRLKISVLELKVIKMNVILSIKHPYVFMAKSVAVGHKLKTKSGPEFIRTTTGFMDMNGYEYAFQAFADRECIDLGSVFENTRPPDQYQKMTISDVPAGSIFMCQRHYYFRISGGFVGFTHNILNNSDEIVELIGKLEIQS